MPKKTPPQATRPFMRVGLGGTVCFMTRLFLVSDYFERKMISFMRCSLGYTTGTVSIVLATAIGMVLFGFWVIRRMVEIEV